MDYPLKIAEQLRPQLQALRKRRGMTQAQLGAAIGVTQARIVEIEANPGLVNLQQIMQILQALGAGLVLRDIDVAAPAARAERDDAPVTPTNRGRW
jgi:HTH-type transcriptional regulator / antitoxin HipB